MNNKTIRFEYVKKEQKEFLEHLKMIKGVNYQEAEFNVPYWLILALQSELSEVLNESLVHKFWTDKKVDREKLIEELSDFVAHMGNLANLLDVDMIIDLEEVQTTSVEVIFNRLAYQITTLNWNKRHARSAFNRIQILFVELVYSLGFNLEELEQAYKAKMKTNYERFK